MESKVKIKIETIQTIDAAGNEDIIDFISEATMEKFDDHFVINYDESDMTEVKGSKTRLKIEKNKMLMIKIGSFSSRMEFEKQKNFKNLYTTPYGTFNLNYTTEIFENNLNENGKGKVYVEYKVDFGNTGDSYNKLSIEIL